MPFPFVGDLDLSKVHCMPMEKGRLGQKLVRVFLDNTSTANSNKVWFQLARDEDEPVVTHFSLDRVTDEQTDKTKRGLAMRIASEAAIGSLTALDEALIDKGVANSKEWFGKELKREQVLDRYKPILAVSNDGEHTFMKAKVKCTGHAYPTKINRVVDGTYYPSDERVLACKGVRGVPIVSAFQLYFFNNNFGLTFQVEDFLVYHVEEFSETSKFALKRPLQAAKDGADEDAHDAKACKVILECDE